MRIDLHTHSNASDGTDTPAQLVANAAKAGLDVVALTDHDTTAGWAEAEATLPSGLTLIKGAEISARWFGAETPIGLHMLAYLFDPQEPQFAAALKGVRDGRDHRAERMVDLLAADGVDVTWAEVQEHAKGGTVGRPHLAQALIRRGLVKTVEEAFQSRWLGERYRIPKKDLDVFEVLRLIRGAGGVAVFAHPAASKRGPIVPDELIVSLAGAGLFGLEADHTDHSPAEVQRMKGLASELGLAVTGSSDYHGTNKTVQLGVRLTAPSVLEQMLAKTGSA